MFQKRMAPLNKEMKPQGRGNVPALRAEATRPEQDHSRIESARSNSWAECRDTKCRHRADGETCLLTFSFVGLLRFARLSGVETCLLPDHLARVFTGAISVASRAMEAYDVRARDPNRGSDLTPGGESLCLDLLLKQPSSLHASAVVACRLLAVFSKLFPRTINRTNRR